MTNLIINPIIGKSLQESKSIIQNFNRCIHFAVNSQVRELHIILKISIFNMTPCPEFRNRKNNNSIRMETWKSQQQCLLRIQACKGILLQAHHQAVVSSASTNCNHFTMVMEENNDRKRWVLQRSI